MEKYQYIEKIGSGSYGEVSLIKDKKDQKKYVVKKVSLLGSYRERKAAQLEVDLLKTLKHPNIVGYHDSFDNSDGNLMIVMAFCEGGDLNRYLRQKPDFLDEQNLVEWLVQICMALQYLHSKNILHRDLKTQNIFLTSSHIIKLGDLGIARVLDSAQDLATTVIGTPYYMSPELFRSTPYGKESDVWALGCCTFEMMTKKHAFNARDINSLAAKVLRGKSPKMPDNYSRKLTDLVSRMLSFDSRKRPTVAQILQQRFIRDRIKIFLQKQRPNSGKNSKKQINPTGSVRVPVEEKVPAKPPRTNISSSSLDTDFDTMQVEVGTLALAQDNSNPTDLKKHENLAMVETQKAKEFQMKKFLSEGAIEMVEKSENKANPETYIVQKNVKREQVPDHPVIEEENNNPSLGSSLARQRRRNQRTTKPGPISPVYNSRSKKLTQDETEFIHLLTGTLNAPIPSMEEEPEVQPVVEKPGILAGEQTLSSISRIANRMTILRRQLFNELGNRRLGLAMEAVALDDDTEMWNRLNKLLPEENRQVWAARVHTLLLLDRALDNKF